MNLTNMMQSKQSQTKEKTYWIAVPLTGNSRTDKMKARVIDIKPVLD